MPGSTCSDHTSPQPPRPHTSGRRHHHHSSRSSRADRDRKYDRDQDRERSLRHRSPSPSSSCCSSTSTASHSRSHRRDGRQHHKRSNSKAIIMRSSNHERPNCDDASSVEEYTVPYRGPPPRYPHPNHRYYTDENIKGRFDEKESRRRKKLKDKERGVLIAAVIFVASLILCMD